MRPIHFALALSIGLLSCGQLQAAFLLESTTGAFSFDPQNDELGLSGGTVKEYGLVFQVVGNPSPNPLSVYSLGFYDFGDNGLAESHYVQLYQMTSPVNNPGTYTLIAQTTVASGTTAPLLGDFRYSSITPVNLAAGGTYMLLASVGTISGNSPLDKFGQLHIPVNYFVNGTPLLNTNFVEGGTWGVGLAKSLIDTSGFVVGGDAAHTQLFNPTSGGSTTTVVQPNGGLPFVVNLQFGAVVPEPGSIAVWSVLGALGLVSARKRQSSVA